jgi:hypothetical protein
VGDIIVSVVLRNDRILHESFSARAGLLYDSTGETLKENNKDLKHFGYLI